MIGPNIEILSACDGCIYLSPDAVQELALEGTFRFKLLVAMSEQLGYHFAKVYSMAGDCRN